MILNPLINNPRITQICTFLPNGEENPAETKANRDWAKNFYKKWGLKGHTGLDFGVRIGTTVYAPFDCKIRVREASGLGLYIECYSMLREETNNRLRIRLAHLSQVKVKDGEYEKLGNAIAFSGNSWWVAPHLHLDMALADKDYKRIGKCIYIDPNWLLNWNN